MANETKASLSTEEPELSVIQRVAEALDDDDAGETPAIVLNTDRSSPPLPPRRRG